MNFRTENKIREELLTKLRRIIGKKIAIISALNGLITNNNQLVLNNIQLDFLDSHGDNSLILRNFYEYYPIHSDELNNIGITILEFDTSPLGLRRSEPTHFDFVLPKTIEIKEIRIYGQHRIRKWSRDFVQSQNVVDELDSLEKHSDEIYTLEIVQFVSANDEQSIYFKASKNGIEVLISETTPPYFNTTYRKGDLDLNYSWLDDQDDETGILLYKEHYRIY